MLPEEKARVKIDKQLRNAGWDIVARNEYLPNSTSAVKEALMGGNTESDYLLFIDGKAIAVVEAKREEKKDIADYKSKVKEAQSRPYCNPRHHKPENEPEFFKEMSDECMARAIAILDTVFKSIESLGGSINSDLSVKIRGDIVRFRMVES